MDKGACHDSIVDRPGGKIRILVKGIIANYLIFNRSNSYIALGEPVDSIMNRPW